MKEQPNQETPQIKKTWHDKNYKLLLIIPLILFTFSIIYMVSFYSANGDFINKDISLTGGTSVTIYEKLDSGKLEQYLQTKLENVHIGEIYDLITQEQKALVIETTSDGELTKKVLEDYLEYELTEKNSSFEFTGSNLSEGFYKQLLFAILIAFVFMGIVIFIIFRISIPSLAVILCAFADILMTLVAVNILGIKVSSAGIVAFLMLIGYSVDTDILLTSRVLKRREESLNKRISSSVKTGMTMSITALISFIVVLFVVKSFSSVLTQIFTILSIGLFFDMINTWITNVSLLKWYMEKKGND